MVLKFSMRDKKPGAFRRTLSLLVPFCFFQFTACCLLPVYSHAARIYPSAGSTSAAFLKLGVGARAVAMGGAFTAVPGDPYAVYWNPAGLAYAERQKNIGFFHNEYFQGLGQEFLAYTVPSGAGSLGLGLNYFYTSKELERRSGLYEADPVNPISPVEGKFGAYDLAFSAAYGREYERGLALGAAVKVIRQSIDDETGASAAVDLGMLRSFTWRGADYTAGLTVQNIGPGIKFVSRRYDLPLSFKAGLSRRLEESGALVALEADKPVDNYPSLILGVEYPMTGRFVLRSGYRYRVHGNELGAWSGFSAGAGVVFERLTFDYAFTPFGVLGNSHRFSINLRFGGEAPVPAPPVAAARVPEAEAGFRDFAFSASPRPLTISPRGARYEISAVSGECGISSMKFRTLLRGEAAAGFLVAEGIAPAVLPADLPAGMQPLKVWRPRGIPGSVQGDISFEFRAAKAGAAGEVLFLYRSGGGWREAPVVKSGEDADHDLFSVNAPVSSHYVLAVKK